jgi:hypothetical protein
MKALSLILLLGCCSASAKENSGVVVKILPDTLVLDQSCRAIADVEAKTFSLIYACKDVNNTMYFYNFRPNNIDIVADFKKSASDVVVNKNQFGVYTLFELSAINAEKTPIKFVTYCNVTTCLDLVSDNEYDKSVQEAITAQLRGN